MAFNETGSEVSKTPETHKLDFDADKLIGIDTKESKPEVASNANPGAVDPDKLIEPAQREYRDDNGEVYRTGDNLEPNNKYEVNGYVYETDSRGRITSAEGWLHIDETPRKEISSSMESIGKGDQREGDQRGHLIADRFGGSNGLENIVAMNGEVNQRDYKAIESECAKGLESGKEVYMKVVPKYDGDSNRPSAFRVIYTIDGEKSVKTLKNEGSVK